MDPFVKPLKDMGVEVVPYYIGGIRNDLATIVKTLRELRASAKTCDISHAQYGSLCGFLTAFLPGRKLISLRGSDLYPVSVGSIFFRARLLISRLLTRISLPMYDHIIVMSNDMKRILNRRNATVIPDGIDTRKFQPMDRAAARAQLGLPADMPQILYISLSQTSPIKRKKLALDSLNVVRVKYPDVKMLAPENVDHDLMPVYVNASDLILCTSTHEGWPNCIKEALACNVPFVSTDISDLGEVARRTQSCRVADDNPLELGRAVVEVLDSRVKEDLRSEALAMDVQVSAAALKKVYEAMLVSDD